MTLDADRAYNLHSNSNSCWENSVRMQLIYMVIWCWFWQETWVVGWAKPLHYSQLDIILWIQLITKKGYSWYYIYRMVYMSILICLCKVWWYEDYMKLFSEALLLVCAQQMKQPYSCCHDLGRNRGGIRVGPGRDLGGFDIGRSHRLIGSQSLFLSDWWRPGTLQPQTPANRPPPPHYWHS